jgi:hypothetical protein
MPNLVTHRHNTEVLLGGVTYARVVEIISGYTITFEDGQYAVNLTGANSNIGDVVNVNQVSIRSANSAGLISNSAIEFAAYNNQVWIDETTDNAGVTFPNGTPQAPVNNLADAILIAESLNLEELHILGDFEFASSDFISDYKIYGQGLLKSEITMLSGSTLANCEFYDMTVTGDVAGVIGFTHCILDDVSDIGSFGTAQPVLIEDCVVEGTLTFDSAYTGIFTSLNCWAGVGLSGGDVPILDINSSSSSNVLIRNWSGGLEVQNVTQDIIVTLDAVTGGVILDSTISDGVITLRGQGTLEDNTLSGATVNSDGFNAGSGTGGTADWTTAEKSQIRDALGVDGAKTEALSGQLQENTTASKVAASNAQEVNLKII